MNTPVIALLYDFDKTLCTTDMEDYTFIPPSAIRPASSGAEPTTSAAKTGWTDCSPICIR